MTTPTAANVAYGPLPAQVVDIYVPATPAIAPPPLFLMIHGGAWHTGGKDSGPSYKNGIRLAGEGYAVAMINYRLLQHFQPGTIPNSAETHMWPAAIIDAQRAVCWLKQNAATYGFDPTKIIAWGDSAGACLAVQLAVRQTLVAGAKAPIEGVSPQVAAAIGHSTTVDFAANLALGPDDPAYTGYDAEAAELQGLSAAQIADASSITHISSESSPIAFSQGSADTQVPPSQATALGAACLANGVPYNYQPYTGGHVFAGLAIPQRQAICEAAETWVLGQLLPGGAST